MPSLYQTYQNKQNHWVRVKSLELMRSAEMAYGDGWDWELGLVVITLLVVDLNKIDQKLDKVKKLKCNFVTKLSLWYVRFCASIIVFFKIINMRGYLWIFNWWWPYSPNPSCPLALKNDLKILTCSFCFASSFHFAIPLQPMAPAISQSLWLAGPHSYFDSVESAEWISARICSQILFLANT